MKIIFTINTPAQLHFFKNVILILKNHGVDILLVLRKYQDTLTLADEMGLEYYIFSTDTKNKFGKFFSFPKDIKKLFNIYKTFKPDFILGSIFYDSFPARLLKIPLIAFLDSCVLDKISFFINFKMLIRFPNVILSPDTIENSFGANHLKIKSYKELAYLQPNYYKSNRKIKDLLNIEGDQEYILLRFNAFDAVHDFNIGGFKDEDKIQLVYKLEKYAKVFISSETGVPKEIKDRVLNIPKNRIHDVIYYAKLLIADTGTMVTEAACLGTPAIMFHPNVKKMGNFIELEQKYRLIFGFERDPNLVINKAVELLLRPNLEQEWQDKRKNLLREKVDITAFMVWFIENYPVSFRMMKDDQNIQG